MTTRVDRGLQQERTALAWERTAVSMVVCGLLFARYGTSQASPIVGVAGVVETFAGGAVLAWAGLHHAHVDRLVRAGEPLVHAPLTRWVGLGTVAFCGLALLSGMVLTLR